MEPVAGPSRLGPWELAQTRRHPSFSSSCQDPSEQTCRAASHHYNLCDTSAAAVASEVPSSSFTSLSRPPKQRRRRREPRSLTKSILATVPAVCLSLHFSQSVQAAAIVAPSKSISTSIAPTHSPGLLIGRGDSVKFLGDAGTPFVDQRTAEIDKGIDPIVDRISSSSRDEWWKLQGNHETNQPITFHPGSDLYRKSRRATDVRDTVHEVIEDRDFSDRSRRHDEGINVRNPPAYPPASMSTHISPPPSRRQSASAAYSSGIIADWTHQSRSVWFQRKAIIIVSCFLAIFIVLIIGAAVFLRDHRDDLEDEEEEDFSDDAALRRMREERRMRSGSKATSRKEKKAQRSGKDQMIEQADESEKVGNIVQRGTRRLLSKQRKKQAKAPDGSSSGSSTAVSKRFASRWIRSTRSESIPTSRNSAEQQPGDPVRTSADGAGSIRSQPGSISRGHRLGAPRSEQVDIIYTDGTRLGSTNTSSSSTRQTNSTAEHAAFNVVADGSRRQPSRPRSAAEARRGLDADDINAADAAEHERQDVNLPPAYIPEGSTAASAQPAPPPIVPEPTYQRPLAGERLGDSKASSSQPTSSQSNVHIPPHVLSALDRQSEATNPLHHGHIDGTAHLATDDKGRLAALAAAASAPGTHRDDSSAPRYSSTRDLETAHDDTIASHQGVDLPSAPQFDADEADFEPHGQDDFSESAAPESSSAIPAYQPGSVTAPAGKSAASATKGKGKGDGSLLPAPPSPHAQAFSPFDQPYRAIWPPSPTSMARSPSASSATSLDRVALAQSRSRLPSQPSHLQSSPQTIEQSEAVDPERLARRAEKQREAGQELSLLASSPGDLAVTNGAQGLGGSADAEMLPAYQGRGSDPLSASSATTGLEAPEASAPNADEILRESGDEQSCDAESSRQATLSEPSAPPALPENDNEEVRQRADVPQS